jgi:hypothetical protein
VDQFGLGVTESLVAAFIITLGGMLLRIRYRRRVSESWRVEDPVSRDTEDGAKRILHSAIKREIREREREMKIRRRKDKD